MKTTPNRNEKCAGPNICATMLLVSGTVFEEGEFVQDDLLLRRVDREEAEFVFRGFRLAKKW